MLLPLGPLLDPQSERLNFFRSQLLEVGVDRRHPLRLVIAGDPSQQFARDRAAGDDGLVSVNILEEFALQIEPQF